MLKNQKGVTLVELLIVIVVLGIISALSVVAVGNIVRNTENGVFVENIRAIERAIYLRGISHDNEAVPSVEEVLGVSGTGGLTNEQWVLYSSTVFGDYIDGDWPSSPFGGAYVYRFYQDTVTTGWAHGTRWRQVIGY